MGKLFLGRYKCLPPSFNEDGEVEKYITVGTDITEKKKAENRTQRIL